MKPTLKDGDMIVMKRKSENCGWANNTFNCTTTGHIALVSIENTLCVDSEADRCITLYESNYSNNGDVGSRTIIPNYNTHDYFLVNFDEK